MSSRSMTINLANWVPSTELTFGHPFATSGSVPQAVPPQIAQGQTMAVSTSSNSSGCIGGFNLSDGAAYFGVSYNHPSGPGDTTVTVITAPGYLAGANAATFPGHHSVANLNLYRGVPANAGWAAPLELLASPPRNNCQDFVNSMFGPNMRNTSVIIAAYHNPAPNGYVQPADFTGGQMVGFTAQWAQQWLTGSCPACTSQDAALISLLANYLETAANAGPLSLWIPQISFAGGNPSVFNLNGYREMPFKSNAAWNADAVNAFLTLLASGGHFVAISANDDLPTGVTMQSFDQFFKSSGLPTNDDIGNSHYASITNITGTYYLSINDDFAPENCGLILAFLAGRTVNNLFVSPGSYNTFIQLEGWQAGTSRHSADYATYKETLWNISTFAACPYSEKRATTIFLAPPGWIPQPYQITCMMPYVGAYANSDLISDKPPRCLTW